MVKVSVILPVYNVEKYLTQCLDSITRQTLHDIEIICINDGSTDGSYQILKEYAAKDNRIIILNQENRGAGAARNKGLGVAKGEYLAFLDSDDFFESKMLEIAYIKCKETNADFVVFRSDEYIDDKGLIKKASWTIKQELLPAKDIFSCQDINDNTFRVFIGWAWDKLYRKSFIDKSRLSFQEIRTTNDLYFVFSALVEAERISIIDIVLAHHRKNIPSSLSVTREKSWYCFFEALLALRNRLYAKGIYEMHERSFINYALHFCLWHLNTISGESFALLYNKLKADIFDQLNISGKPAAFFYNLPDYEQYRMICDFSVTDYLLDKLKRLDNENLLLKKKLKEKHIDILSYKIGRFVTYIPRLIRRGTLKAYKWLKSNYLTRMNAKFK